MKNLCYLFLLILLGTAGEPLPRPGAGFALTGWAVAAGPADGTAAPPCAPRFAVQLDKMNVVYVGFDNSMSVAMEGVAPEHLHVEALVGSSLRVRSTDGCGRYVVSASRPGAGELIVGSTQTGDTVHVPLRVKRIPDPVPKLGALYRGGQIPNGAFRAQGGIAAVLENFDFDARCDVLGYDVSYIRPKEDPVEKHNTGARWNPGVAELIAKARPGDFYYFDAIKCRCPGDVASRELGGLYFRIR